MHVNTGKPNSKCTRHRSWGMGYQAQKKTLVSIMEPCHLEPLLAPSLHLQPDWRDSRKFASKYLSNVIAMAVPLEKGGGRGIRAKSITNHLELY